MIASRVLKLLDPEGDVDIPMRIFAPAPVGAAWSCRYEIDWPDGRRASSVEGADSLQSLPAALQAVGAELYTADYHKSGELIWSKRGMGYGFPVPRNLRDLLVGDDAKFL